MPLILDYICTRSALLLTLIRAYLVINHNTKLEEKLKAK